jgi:hypothetical protein
MNRAHSVFYVLVMMFLTPATPVWGEAGSKKSKILKVGTQAPAFSLPILKIVTDKDGKHTGEVTKKKVTLADLTKEKKTTVLFFSSYT